MYYLLLAISEKMYTINVKTGDVSGAGTDANVFLIMYGDLGDSGEHKLHKSETHRDKFEKGQVHFCLSLIMRKPVFGVSGQVQCKPGCTTTENG